MNEEVEHCSYNYSYGHGIISQNCLAKKCSEKESVQLLSKGTFVQILSVRLEEFIVRMLDDEVQVDPIELICKRADIIHVPENLFEPLLAVKKSSRLPLVQDLKVAESVATISVGQKVQVLGPDSKIICIANVIFKNYITKLGVGVYFGLQIVSPKESCEAIIRKITLLQPGTKGFPRGCDAVVTVDKIRPFSETNIKEKFFYNFGKENVKETVKEEINFTSYRTVTELNLKDRLTSSVKKMENFNINFMLPNSKKIVNYENSIELGEQVVYLNGDTPEKGVVKWMGLIKNSFKIGVEFENPIGSGDGCVDGIQLFKTKCKHALVLPPMALVKLTDFLNSSKENFYYLNNNTTFNNNIHNQKIKRSSCVNNNNNNYNINNNNNYDNSSVSNFKSTDLLSDIDENYKPSVNLGSMKEKEYFETFQTEKIETQNRHLLEFQHNSKSFDFGKGNERKLNTKKHFNSLDCELGYYGEPKIQSPKTPTQDFYDFSGSNWTRQKKQNQDCYCDNNSLSCTNSEYCIDDQKSKEFKGKGEFWKMSTKNWDDFYIPVTVLEQSILAKKCQKQSNCEDESALYDELPSEIRKASIYANPDRCSFQKNLKRISDKGLFKEDFYKYRHTLGSLLPEIWKTSRSDNSGSDENFYDIPKPSHGSQELGKGSLVELSYKGEPHYGVIRWIGTISDDKDEGSCKKVAGIEMEEEKDGFTDGTFGGKRYFECNPRKAFFVPLSKCRKDSRFLDDTQRQTSTKINYGQIDCPIVEGTIPPINRKGDIDPICGKNRGIQGHHNSCYLDATLFSMFAFTSVFDTLLYRPPTKQDVPQYTDVQKVLKEEIVNPLRKNLYVRADRVMKLRTLLDKLSSVSGLTSEEKDPEEFLNSLLAQILKAEPFLKLSSGQEAFYYQLFVEKDERLSLPSVQQLFEQSFVTSDIKLKQIPSCLIIQMPRFGKSFKMYNRILPPLLLDITDIIENSPRQCTVCGKLAEFECKDCFGQNGIGNGLESISFCKICLETAHNHHCRTRHNYKSLTVPVEFYELQEHCAIPRVYLELFAVVCIETSHYVAFVKCGSGSDAPWCFFDSMADRKGEQNGYNIPEMVSCPDLPYWLSEEGVKTLNEMGDEKQLPEHAKRLFSDAYMCMYQSPDLMMYR